MHCIARRHAYAAAAARVASTQSLAWLAAPSRALATSAGATAACRARHIAAPSRHVARVPGAWLALAAGAATAAAGASGLRAAVECEGESPGLLQLNELPEEAARALTTMADTTTARAYQRPICILAKREARL